jgi:hypothetical protein
MPSLKQLTAAALAAIALSPLALIAQEKPVASPSAHYKLTYRLLEVGADGKITNSRTYVAMVGTGQGEHELSKIRSGDRTPIPVSKSGGNTEFQYQSVGTDIDTLNPQIQDRQLSLHVSAASSSVGKPAPGGIPDQPVLRETRWESNVVVTLDKPTIIFSSDNVSDTGKTELELTATEIH